MILAAFLRYKVKLAFERGIRRTQAKIKELGKTSRTAGIPFLKQAENTGRREALPPRKHLHTHTLTGFSFTFL